MKTSTFYRRRARFRKAARLFLKRGTARETVRLEAATTGFVGAILGVPHPVKADEMTMLMAAWAYVCGRRVKEAAR